MIQTKEGLQRTKLCERNAITYRTFAASRNQEDFVAARCSG